MSDFDLVLRGNVVLADRVIADGHVAVRDGRIARVGGGDAPAARRTEDFHGSWIIPGVIDGQVHSGSQAGQEGLGMASRAAAAGGVTVMVDMPYDEPEPIVNRTLFEHKRAQVQNDAHVDVALYATIARQDGLDAIAGLIEAGVCGFKFSTFEANPTRFPRITDDVLFEAFRRIAPSGLLCGVHNQDQEMTRVNIARAVAAGDTGWDAFGRAHTPLIEDLATARIYEIGAATGARAHAVHVSTSRGFEISAMYRRAGHHASIETCVQYLMLNEEEHVRRFGARAKHYPPIRPRAEVDRLWTHVARGACDFVSSDHVAWGLERKGDPNIFANSSGGPGLETLLPALWTGCAERGLAPTTAVKLLCEGPARAFCLADKGRLAVGADADIVVLQPGRFPYDPSTSLSAVRWSSFEDRLFTVRVAATYLRGTLAWDGRRICNDAGSGRFIAPSPAAFSPPGPSGTQPTLT
ncbi:dihydroorotase family protein [Reyranella sp. CPCC 100927]|uniref:dihydroorotase n=1 Tax=Reyranella sp. CPCC 100927 TaxID=2599616 RepID=UPI0011B6D04E|nr:amidohydrolase family protein [Reyranella sp. CPCC 100927]TWS96861.1 amidohydrolase family protein [Reyranella sp. CPCC 100927]